MNAKTAGQAVYERFWTDGVTCGDYRPFSLLPEGKKRHWDAIAQAARDWQPQAPEKTLGQVAIAAFGDAGLDAEASWQAAGEACARIGAARERVETIKRLQQAAWTADYDVVSRLVKEIIARGKEQQP